MRPIWESASRPLFVRSVWQEAIGRRHFILDYEPRQRQRWKRQKTRLRGNYQQSQSCEIFEPSTEDSVEYLDEYLLLDATKLTLQQQQSLPMTGRPGPIPSSNGGREQRQNSRQSKRRAWLLSRGRTYHLDQHLGEHQSRRSSLQDAGSSLTPTANNPEERLAERVLHWLDLAGRTDIVKEAVPTPPATSSAQLARSAQRMQRSHHRSMSLKRVATAAANHQRSLARKPSAKPMPSQQQQQAAAQQGTSSSPASNAKPITIIFNKEGVPVRLNRPARNIDLCTLSSSASTTRRMAGQLASARLYSGATTSPLSEETRTPPLSSRGMASAASDSRKQLHIFMPSLPKKGLLGAGSTEGSGIGGASEDALSTSFSELCQL